MSGPYLLGIDMGTGGARAGVFNTGGGILGTFVTEWKTDFPRPGYAEQNPDDWWRCAVQAVRGAMGEAGVAPGDIIGISLDATAATVVALDENGRHLRPALLWMDVRSSEEADIIAATGDPALKYSGLGPVSAEWGVPKALWLKRHEPEVWKAADTVCDCTDWLVHRLTGEWSMSINHAAGKYFYDGDTGGWPVSLYEKAGIEDLLDKVPGRMAPLGEVIGGLAQAAAEELGLVAGTPVAEGGIDAYAGAIGLGVVEPGKMALITGSSHVMIGQSPTPLYGRGIWGSYTDSIIPGEYTVEGGQISTGSIVEWFKNNLAPRAQRLAAERGCNPYAILNEEASRIPIGSDGLILLDHFQGNRTPYSDSRSRGVFWGLSLSHTEGHMFRAILEGICFGTENIFQNMRAHGFPPKEVIVSGGPTKSRLWMQMHADVSNLPMVFTDVTEGPLLGSAMLAGVGAGVFKDLPDAARAMVHTVDVIKPDPEAHQEYQFNYQAYLDTYPVMQGLMDKMTRHLANQ